jgi:hypothetical protein
MTISATLISKNFSLPQFFLNDDRSQSKAISVYIMLYFTTQRVSILHGEMQSNSFTI